MSLSIAGHLDAWSVTWPYYSERRTTGRALSRRSAFSLVELLVVIGILALLMGIILPAIQRVREAANNLACRNNLRMIGLAFQLYANDHRAYPMGGCAEAHFRRSWSFHFNPKAPPIPTTRERQNWGWAYQILPSVGLENQWAVPDTFSIPSGAKPPYNVPPRPYQTEVAFYYCPTRRSPSKVLRTDYGLPVAMTDYAGNGGHLSFVDPATGKPIRGKSTPGAPNLTSLDVPHTGTVLLNRSFRFGGQLIDQPLSPNQVIDGLSKTLLLAEKRTNLDLLGEPQPGDRLGFCSGFGIDTIRTGGVPTARDARSASDMVFDGFGSTHPFGFNALFADGSVRTLSYNVGQPSTLSSRFALTIMQALCNRNDGLAISERDLE
jgi:prepilin-type N-terminal cleavage/methylation domain-containing protein/prepilin-type processing-associated H-X9-DG protein